MKKIIVLFCRIIKVVVYLPLCIPTIIATAFCFLYSGSTQILKIRGDGQAFLKIIKPNKRMTIFQLYILFVNYREFRSIVYMRIGFWGDAVKWILPGQTALFIRTPSKDFGEGLYIQHGHSTRIGAKSIGKNFFVNQNVTVGWRGNGLPIIGDNVRIGTGAVVLGDIKVGNNVKIGANATVVKDIPDNCTVIPVSSYICKLNGEKTDIQL